MNLKLLLDNLMLKIGYMPVKSTLEVKIYSCKKTLLRAEQELDPHLMRYCGPFEYNLSLRNKIKKDLIEGADAAGLIEWIAIEGPGRNKCKLEGRLIVGEYPKSKYDHLSWLLDFNKAFSKSKADSQ